MPVDPAQVGTNEIILLLKFDQIFMFLNYSSFKEVRIGKIWCLFSNFRKDQGASEGVLGAPPRPRTLWRHPQSLEANCRKPQGLTILWFSAIMKNCSWSNRMYSESWIAMFALLTVLLRNLKSYESYNFRWISMIKTSRIKIRCFVRMWTLIDSIRINWHTFQLY